MREEIRARLQRQRIEELSKSNDLPDSLGDLEQLTVPLPSTPVDGVVTTQLSTVAPKQIRWLWPGHIPYGAMTLVIGDPGLGKSQLTLDLAANVTRGTPWPDGTPSTVGNVLLISCEDSIERTIIPRLNAAKADLDRIVSLQDVKDGKKLRMFSLKTDLKLLERTIESQYIDLIVIDPLNGFLGDTNSWKESEVRNVLGPACVMADKHDVALVGVVHLNKDNTRSAIHRVIGSVAFSAVTRSMFAVAQHPSAPRMRYFVSVKQNYCPHPPTLGFSMVEEGGLVWDGLEYEKVTADSILAVGGAPEDKAERKTAREWLRATLENGPVRTKLIVKMARESAISDRALQRAKYDLKVTSQRHAIVGRLGGGYWEWRLP